METAIKDAKQTERELLRDAVFLVLAGANKALEGRILKLERQLAAVIGGQK